MEGKSHLDHFKVGSLPTVIYIPNFITESEQTQLLNNIYDAPLSKWKILKHRRLQNWGGIVHEKGLLSQELPSWLKRITLHIFEESQLFPSPINHVLINEYLPNQGIMPHQDGPAYYPVVAIVSLGSPVVMDFTPHPRLRLCTGTFSNNIKDSSDDEAFEMERDVGDKWLDGHHPFSLLLMPCSLLIFKDEVYSDYLHGIKDNVIQSLEGVVNLNGQVQGHDHAISQDLKILHRTTSRVSLTCRFVLKAQKNLFKF